MNNLIKDISVTTTIPVLTLTKLSDVAEICMCHAVKETLLEYDNECKIDIGIGYLLIKITDDAIQYKFIPAKSLETKLVDLVANGIDPLAVALEDRLADKIANLRKDLI